MGDERPVWVSGPKQRANAQYRCPMGNTAGMNGLESRKGITSLNFDPEPQSGTKRPCSHVGPDLHTVTWLDGDSTS